MEELRSRQDPEDVRLYRCEIDSDGNVVLLGAGASIGQPNPGYWVS
jgi:hypothetical protein